MKFIKKIWFWLFAFMPFSAGAIAPLVVGGIVAAVGIAGFSVYRSVSPVNMQDALEFFSSCWSCHVFSDILLTMSNLLPPIYNALGHVVAPMILTLFAIFMAWRFASGFLNGKMENVSKYTANLGFYLIKITFIIGLLFFPLPRFITSVLIEPALTIGTSLDYAISDNNKFAECMVATAIADPSSESVELASVGAFSPKLRHQLACEVANVHQITGLGMTVGWTMLNMAFDYDYMHKIIWKVPVFPNIPMFFAGLLILVLYFFALLPIPLYFLEVFIKLSMDLIMLPLMLMGWMFDAKDDWPIFPAGGRVIKNMIDDLVKAIVGIVLTMVFLMFSIMFLNAAFGTWNGVSALETALSSGDSKILIDGLMMQNNSLITVILMGIFIAMFMSLIPKLSNMLFKIEISTKYYDTAKKDVKILAEKLKKWIPKKSKSSEK